MKTPVRRTLLLLSLFALVSAAGARPRLVVATDGEIDDHCSMVRLLLLANEFEVEALVYTSSIFHSVANGNWAGTEWIQGLIQRYGEVHGNLIRHDLFYPPPQALLDRVFIGNIATAGGMTSDTPGSERIVELLLDPDTRPLLLLGWGGNNTFARALAWIEEHRPEEMDRVSAKARLVFTLDQDDTLETYIRHAWPGLPVVGAYGCWKGIGYATNMFVPTEERTYYSSEWMLEHVTRDHGPLCAARPNAAGGLFVGEGDSVTFLHAFPNGLRGLGNPEYGSWGGRYQRGHERDNWWSDALDEFDVAKTVWRWAPDFQRELAARADWCVTEPEQANHPPTVSLDHAPDLTAVPGQRLDLRVSAEDPDGDELRYHWWYYAGPSACATEPVVTDQDRGAAVLNVPDRAGQGDVLHLVCSVTDTGTPPLTRYAHVRVEVTEGGSPPSSPFVLGVNFDGPDVVVDGNRWRGMEGALDAGLEIHGAASLTRPEAPVPLPEPDAAGMLRSTVTAPGDFRVTQVLENGEYWVYLWVFEWGDFYWSFTRVFDVVMEGRTVGRNIGALRSGAWRNYGPFVVSVVDGRLDLEVVGKSREPHLAGMSVHRAPSVPRSVFRDPGFEGPAPGPLQSGRPEAGWEVHRTGRESIQGDLRVYCVDAPGAARSGEQCVSLSIPAHTEGFEFVTIGQRLVPESDRLYEATAWVRWPDGPDAAPPDAGTISGHPSAIVSFWARHRNNTGEFAGRDVWLFDRRWTRLSFRFRATAPGEPALVYVSLLPNQTPVATTVLVDDFDVIEVRDVPGRIVQQARNRVQDSGFDGQQAGLLSPPWHFASMGGTGVSCRVVAEGEERFVSLSMAPGTSNYESGQIWQHLVLEEGVRYEIACRIRWESFAADLPPPIVNYGIYHEPTNTWYGPVDQALEASSEWVTYRFVHVPPADGPWKLYVQLNGWGNFGNAAGISVDDVSCIASP